MTVKELREALEGVPDDAHLCVKTEIELLLDHADFSYVDHVGHDKLKNNLDIYI